MLRSKIEAVGRPSPAPWRPSVRPSRGALCARPSASVQFVRRPPPAPGTVLPVCRSLAFASMTNDRTSCSIRPGFLRATIKSRSWIIKLWQFYSLSFPSKENEREREITLRKSLRDARMRYFCPQIYLSIWVVYEIITVK